MTREDLIFNIARKLSKEMDAARFHIPSDIAEEAARIVLSAIEQSGCTICPNEPTPEQVDAGTFGCRFEDTRQASETVYANMLSASPLATPKPHPAKTRTPSNTPD